MSERKYLTVCSSHLDREWYASFEETRIFTDVIINRVLELLETMPEYVYMLDGQTSVLEDYLEIYPEKEEQIAKFIKEGRFLIGPWYIQPDECIPAGESMIRNLLLGEKIAHRYGETEKVGYVPDSFGHVSQLPQIFEHFGIRGAFLMRGCPENTPRDFIWKGADGTEILAIQYPYGTGGKMDSSHMRNGIRPDRNREEYEESLKVIDEMKGFKPIAPYTLVTMSGDMLPPPSALKEFGISSFDRFEDCFALNEKVREHLPVLEGELRESDDIVYSLQDTVVSRVYLKQENQRAQNQLLAFAEPLCAFTYGVSDRYPAGSLAKSWKYLLENHTHDGICGCSNNDVCREMMTRFRKSLNISETWNRIAMSELAAQTDTEFTGDSNVGNHQDTEEYAALVVFNPQPYPVSENVVAEILYPADSAPEQFMITDSQGNLCPSQILEVRDQEFIRSDFECVQHFAKDRVYRVAFCPGTLPALGIKAFRLDKVSANKCHAAAGKKMTEVSCYEKTMENEWIRLTVEENGTLSVLDKKSGNVYDDLHYFTEEGDGGDTYAFRPIADGTVYDSRALKWEFAWKHTGPIAATCVLKTVWELPQEMSGSGTGRSETKVINTLEYEVTVLADSPVIKIRTKIGNHSKDHRIRACFPTQILTDYVWADGQFSLEKRAAFRDIRRGNTQPAQTFAAVCRKTNGLAILQKGLHQYEYLKDGKGTLALSLLRGQGALYRAFFERYNDEFSECQCLGVHEMEYAVYPFAGEDLAKKLPVNVLRAAAQFQSGILACQTGTHSGCIAPETGFMEITEGELQLVSFKMAEDRKRILARFYNPYPEKQQVVFSVLAEIDGVVRMNTHEDITERISVQETDSMRKRICFEVGPCEIVTLGFEGKFSIL